MTTRAAKFEIRHKSKLDMRFSIGQGVRSQVSGEISMGHRAWSIESNRNIGIMESWGKLLPVSDIPAFQHSNILALAPCDLRLHSLRAMRFALCERLIPETSE